MTRTGSALSLCLPVDFRVRPLQAGDEYRLSRFYVSLSEQSRSFFEPYRDTTPQGLSEVIEKALGGTDLSLVVIDADEEVLAHIFFSNILHETPHIGIGLRDAYQNCGLGSVLFAYMVNVGRHVLRKKSIGLTVVKENQRAVHLYNKHGFRVTRENVHFREPGDSYEMQLDF